jgi:hypothetical protein
LRSIRGELNYARTRQDLFLETYKRFMTDEAALIAANPIDPALSQQERAKVQSALLFAHQQKYKGVRLFLSTLMSTESTLPFHVSVIF